MGEAVLELNASDERGIEVVRGKVKQFAQKHLDLPPNRQKLIILDEADSMTLGAQQALRRLMELWPNTRFALACNSLAKIIEPLQSRCALLRYSKPTNEQILGRLLYIVEKEGVQADPEGLEAILFASDGDVRQAVQHLQAAWTGLGRVTAESVWRVCDQPSPEMIKQILQSCVEGDIEEALSLVRRAWQQGYSGMDIITSIFRVVKLWDYFTAGVREREGIQLQFIKEISSTHQRMVQGVVSLTQLEGLIARLCL